MGAPVVERRFGMAPVAELVGSMLLDIRSISIDVEAEIDSVASISLGEGDSSSPSLLL